MFREWLFDTGELSFYNELSQFYVKQSAATPVVAKTTDDLLLTRQPDKLQ